MHECGGRAPQLTQSLSTELLLGSPTNRFSVCDPSPHASAYVLRRCLVLRVCDESLPSTLQVPQTHDSEGAETQVGVVGVVYCLWQRRRARFSIYIF